jgi:cytochrome c oxidase subunit 4/cytochrome o ubiquinol oxidase operon protein cyoD
MTTHATPTPAAPQPGAGHETAPSGVQVHCERCRHANPWSTRFCGQCGAWLGDAKLAARAEAQRIVAEHTGHEGAHDRSVAFYFLIFVSLAVATITEIIMVEFVPIQAIRLFGLISMSTVKFLLVAMFFMHLKGDKRMYGGMFTFGIALAASYIFALLALV